MTFPADDILYKDVSNIVDELGVDIVTMKVLRKRLEDKYAMPFTESHKEKLSSMVERKFGEPEIQRQLALAEKRKAEGLVNAGKKKSTKETPAKKRGKEESTEGSPKKAKRASKSSKEDAGEKGPKKPTTSYFAFSNVMREKIRAENPTMKITEIATKIGALWKTMSEADKAPYNKMVDEDKKRYEREVAQFKAEGKTLPKASKGKGSKKAPAEDDGRPPPPKRPMTAFFIYLNENREAIKRANPSIKLTDIAVKGSEQWKALSDSAKAPYLQKEKLGKEAYEKEYAAYVKQHGEPAKRSRAGASSESTKKRGKKDKVIVDDDEASESASSSSSSSSSDSDSDSSSDSDSDSSSDSD